LSSKDSDSKIHQFIKAYIESKKGQITEQSNEVFTISYPDKSTQTEYTYQPAISRERKISLLTPGSPMFQQILEESLENGVLCQVLFKPKAEIDALVKGYFKDSSFACEDCEKIPFGEEITNTCEKSPSYYHQINNGKIVSTRIIKNEPVRFLQFYYSLTFQNKLRQKDEEIFTVLVDEDCNVLSVGEINENNFLSDEAIEIQGFKAKLDVTVFEKLKRVADEKIESTVKEKLIFFDLQLTKEIRSKLKSFDKRLKKERREKVISRKHDFDFQQWHANHEALLRREEESYLTNISVKFINLLIINTNKVKFEAILDNNSAIRSSFILGFKHTAEVACPICRKNFSSGYATQDGLYVCKDCVRQSVDTATIYSKKASLQLDEKLNEYFEHDSGFACSVCGKRHSRLLEFKCNHDNSSICIYHYGLCDVCGKVFSKLNLTYTDEFKRQLCPKHTSKNKLKEQ
jgi:hypothetical protein